MIKFLSRPNRALLVNSINQLIYIYVYVYIFVNILFIQLYLYRSKVFEDAKINHLPAQSGEKYHVVKDEDDSNGNYKIGKTCIVKKIRSNNDNDDNIYAAKIISASDGNLNIEMKLIFWKYWTMK